MKMLLVLLVALIVTFNVCTPAQAKSNYKISYTAVTDAVTYMIFAEERITNTGFSLVDNIDYLDPTNLSAFKIGESTTLSFTIKLPNDSKFVVAGVVAVDVNGFYSAMGVSSVVQKGKSPGKPGGVTFQKE